MNRWYRGGMLHDAGLVTERSQVQILSEPPTCQSVKNPQILRPMLCSKIDEIQGCQTVLFKNSAGARANSSPATVVLVVE